MVAVALADASAGFNTQPPEGGWNTMRQLPITHLMFQHTAARRRLALAIFKSAICSCFNTQPPEGGWHRMLPFRATTKCFNTQPPEGGWGYFKLTYGVNTMFQHTAARRRLALP